MDSIPLLKSKMMVPELPQKVLNSDRIKNLNINMHRAVIITAPAGFGKTTAVLLSLHKKRAKVYWYRMEKEDSFLPVFYTHLIEVLFSREAGEVSDPARSLGSIGSISEEYPLLNAVICQNTWSRHNLDSDSAYLVFDDFQNAAGNPALVNTVRYFITNMPPNLRIIVISRVETGIRAGRIILDSDVVDIHGEALRFTKDEIGKLASEVYRIHMGSDELMHLHHISEGWIAGIAMLCHPTGSSRPDLRKLHAGSIDNQEDLFKYFMEEAFKESDRNMLKTLACISVLPDFTCRDLTEIFGMDDAAETIKAIERGNLHITKTKTEVARYHFHALLRNALLSVLNELYSPEDILKIYLKAARYYSNTRDYPRAIRFFLASGKDDEAVRIASREGVRFMDTGDANKVAYIVQAFPKELVEAQPYLLFLYGASLMSIESDQSLEYLHRALTGFLQDGNLDMQMRTVGLIISFAYEKNDLNNIGQVIGQVPKLKAVMSSKYARITLLLSAFMKAAWTDNLRLGNTLCKLIERFGFYQQLWDYTFKMAKLMILYRSGDLQTARGLASQILAHPTALVNDRWKAIGLAVCQAVTSQLGDIKASQKLIGELLSISEKYDSGYALGYGLRLSAYVKYQSRDMAGAVLDMDMSAAAFARSGNLIMDRVGKITKCLWDAEIAPSEYILQTACIELCELQTLKLGQGLLEHSQVIVGALYKEASDLVNAESLLLLGYKASKGKKARQSLCGAAMHLADLYYRKGSTELEDKYLKIWGKTSAEGGYVYFREMNYTTLVRVCARCMEKGIYNDNIQRIISKYFSPVHAVRLMEKPAVAAADPVMFITGCSASQQKKKTIWVKLFGSFQLVTEGVSIDESEWKTRKIRGILKYILANPERPVSREYLASIFWPESDIKAASTSLRAALYELRKILARAGLAFESSDALITEVNNCFQICGGDRVETDTGKFAGLYSKYKSGSYEQGEARSLLTQMIELYKGDFLEDDPYDEWAAVSREHYRSIFIEASHRLAEIHISCGESDLAEALMERLIKVDPFDTAACSMLLKLYGSTGQNARSVSLYRQFSKRYEAEMGVKPDL